MNTIPPEVTDAFRLAAITAFRELVQVEVLSADLPPESESAPAVIATIQLLREPPGKLTLVLSECTAAMLATRYLPAETEITAEMSADVAGEFANVIAGQAKTMLKGTPYHFQLTTPAVNRSEFFIEFAASNVGRIINLATGMGAIQLLIHFG
jgi:CheY-specific phosphatase CheX